MQLCIYPKKENICSTLFLLRQGIRIFNHVYFNQSIFTSIILHSLITVSLVAYILIKYKTMKTKTFNTIIIFMTMVEDSLTLNPLFETLLR